MLTGEVRNKVDKIWSDIWAGGISNPLTVIEQLTYLMFIRSLDEKELENESFEALSGEAMPKIFPQDEEGQELRWSKFKPKMPGSFMILSAQRYSLYQSNEWNEHDSIFALYAGCHVSGSNTSGIAKDDYRS